MHEFDESPEREWWPVGLAHEQPPQNHRVSLTVSSSHQEPVQLLFTKTQKQI